jgi:NADPH-dependent 2,4-dienoyl-CoA reductase/sulfur reductase-like enzyme
MKKTDILIIGGGPAGIQSTRTVKTLSPETSVTVLRPEENSVIYCAIPYAIEGMFGVDKVKKSDELVTGVGAELIREKAVKVDFNTKIVTTESGEEINYKKLFIVTGAKPFVPPIPGSNLKGIFTIKTIPDTERIIEKLKDAKKAVVIGAGAIGIEQAQAYAEKGLETYLIDMADRPIPAMVDKDFGEFAVEELEKQGIKLRFGVALKEFKGSEFVEKVVLGNGEEIDINPGKDIVILSVGMKPEVKLFENTGLNIDKDGIVVNEKMETNIEDVYAAGDVCQFYSVIDKKIISGKLATNAVPMAKVMAKNAIGIEDYYPGFVNGAVTVVGERRFGGTGFTEDFAKKRGFDVITGYGETTSRFPMMPGAKPVKVKIVVDKESKRVIGGQVVGYEAVAERIDVITFAIQNHMTVKQLSKLSYSAQPWQTFFPARNAIVQACDDILNKLRKM